MFNSRLSISKVKLPSGSVALAMLLIASSFVFAQDGPPPPHGGMMGGHELHFLSRYLDLTEAQKVQVKQLLDGERTASSPLMEQMHQSHLQMTQLEQSSNFDETKAQTIAVSQSQTESQLMVAHAKVEAQIFQLLTPAQKTKLTQLSTEREQHFAQHMQRQQSNDPPQTPNN
jgi:Spy/CpxP family protein refolding chaperone